MAEYTLRRLENVGEEHALYEIVDKSATLSDRGILDSTKDTEHIDKLDKTRKSAREKAEVRVVKNIVRKKELTQGEIVF